MNCQKQLKMSRSIILILIINFGLSILCKSQTYIVSINDSIYTCKNRKHLSIRFLKDSLPDGTYIAVLLKKNKKQTQKIIKQIGHYKDSIKDGEFMFFLEDYSTGAHYLHKVEYYEKGILHGLFEEFNSNNELMVSGHYNSGKKEGEWIYNTSIGTYVVNFSDGKEISWEKIDDFGNVLETGNGKPPFYKRTITNN